MFRAHPIQPFNTMFGDIRNTHGEKLDHRLHPAAQPQQADHLVIIGHGVTANLDRPFVAALAEGLAAAGWNALRFSFSGNGASEGRFQDSCISKEVADLGCVIDAAQAAGFSVSYAGHSMGGAVGVIRTAEDPRIRRLLGLAPMVETRRFAETEFGSTEPDRGFMWDEETCPLSSTFMNDLRAIGSTLPHAARITVPVCLIHGADDDLVPVEESRALAAAIPGETSLVEIPQCSHVFSGEASTSAMVQAAVDWLNRTPIC